MQDVMVILCRTVQAVFMSLSLKHGLVKPTVAACESQELYGLIETIITAVFVVCTE